MHITGAKIYPSDSRNSDSLLRGGRLLWADGITIYQTVSDGWRPCSVTLSLRFNCHLHPRTSKSLIYTLVQIHNIERGSIPCEADRSTALHSVVGDVPPTVMVAAIAEYWQWRFAQSYLMRDGEKIGQQTRIILSRNKSAERQARVLVLDR
jgi:hypothetical protein